MSGGGDACFTDAFGRGAIKFGVSLNKVLADTVMGYVLTTQD
jgi:hypothetical protein